MALKYVLVGRRNPQDPEGPKKFYAQAKSIGEIDLRSLGKKIVQRCTVNAADTAAVLEALSQLLVEELSESKIVRLGDCGTFYITIGSEGAETEDKYNASMVRDPKVRFRKGIALKEMLNNLKYEKYSTPSIEEEETTV